MQMNLTVEEKGRNKSGDAHENMSPNVDSLSAKTKTADSMQMLGAPEKFLEQDRA